MAKKGYLRVRVDGEIRELTYNMQVDRYKTHDIELVIDRIRVNEKGQRRLEEAVKTAFKQGKGMLMILENSGNGDAQPRYFSRMLMDPDTGISYPEPEPNTFSFNSPYGACPKCNGLGEIAEVDLKKIIPDPKKSIRDGGLDVLHCCVCHEKPFAGGSAQGCFENASQVCVGSPCWRQGHIRCDRELRVRL